MTTCSFCGGDTGLGYNCNRCSGIYCSNHRLPENHDCPGLVRGPTNGKWFNHGENRGAGSDTDTTEGRTITNASKASSGFGLLSWAIFLSLIGITVGGIIWGIVFVLNFFGLM